MKLAVGRADESLEHGADAVADQIMRMSDPTLSMLNTPRKVSRKCAACKEDDEDKKIQTKPIGAATQVGEAPPIVHEVLHSPGRPLDHTTRSYFEPRFERDFADVRIHDDSRAGQSARQVGALAYTVGSHVVVDPAKYHRGSEGGRRLLAHELAHVLQQSSGLRLVQRQTSGCEDLLREPGATSLLAGRVVHRILASHFRATVQGASSVAIPGASAAPP
ncbi:DUF4157 domain-containing protein [Rhodococcus sp. T2V]|uniref:eCIS core domain-containing protein n=1 Tax=Rhodococcus sp. T2V TaxID=3034164 RepID=UPI0023E21A5E|nr:DUF4157 domain-containing protein [Rhodococcus sp. T2V]MDF3308917.1 DUF4157 domain-containing protein [Rhodococcus sp. T2V]